MSETTSNEAGPDSLQSLSDDDLRNLRRATREEMKRRGLGTEKKNAAGAGRKGGGAGRKGAKGKAKAAGGRAAKRAKRAAAGGGGEAA